MRQQINIGGRLVGSGLTLSGCPRHPPTGIRTQEFLGKRMMRLNGRDSGPPCRRRADAKRRDPVIPSSGALLPKRNGRAKPGHDIRKYRVRSD